MKSFQSLENKNFIILATGGLENPRRRLIVGRCQYKISFTPKGYFKTEGEHSVIYWSERIEDGTAAMGQLLIVTHAECNPEIFGPIRFDSLIQKITFSKVLENVLWCLEIPDPTLPSTLKVTQFLIRDRSVKIYDDFLVQMKASVVDCEFSPNEEKLLFGCSDNSLVILGPGDNFFDCIRIIYDKNSQIFKIVDGSQIQTPKR